MGKMRLLCGKRDLGNSNGGIILDIGIARVITRIMGLIAACLLILGAFAKLH